jgi:hypothetical protein
VIVPAFRLRALGKAMSKEDEYRKNAAETVGLASRASTTQDKGRLLAMAEAWLDLADRAHRAASHQTRKAREIPALLRSRLTRAHRDAD